MPNVRHYGANSPNMVIDGESCLSEPSHSLPYQAEPRALHLKRAHQAEQWRC
jgi:hypothetical protein